METPPATTKEVAPKIWLLLLLLLLLSAPSYSLALDNGLAMKPPMGWLNWERFTCQTDCLAEPDNCINEQLFTSMADRLVSDGYRAAGYQYVNIDDCWSEMERHPESERLLANATRFPRGIAYLANYMHQRDLKLGLYGDCGHSTCGGYPAQLKRGPSVDHEQDNYFQLDARMLNDWQVDSFKFDGCFIEPEKAESVCPLMARALAGGPGSRPILLICEWPFYMMYAHLRVNFKLAAESCNVWRYYDDIMDSWLSILNTVDYTVKHQSTIVKYHGPGHWFDPDQLVIGNFGLSLEQARAQMAIWALWSAPLYMSNDLRNIPWEYAKILKNQHLIEVDQDPMGVLGLMVGSAQNNTLQAFVKPVLPTRNGCPSFVVVYLNRNTLGNRQKVSFKLRELLLSAPIFQAAQHLDEIHARGLESGSSIRTRECVERLHLSSEPQGDHSDETVMSLEAFDLFDGGQSLGRSGLDSQLELMVAPSGVRAIRLEESL